VHATVAGVLLALTIPSRTRIDIDEFIDRSRRALDEFDQAGEHGRNVITNPGHQSALQDIESAAEHMQAPMQKLEHNLHPWVAFVIVPVFAFANAGVMIGDNLNDAATSSISLGIVAGLVLGKQIGIVLVSWLLVRFGFSVLPDGVSWRHIHGAACLAGIGFTMSLFIADLAFVDEHRLAMAKIGILGASAAAGLIGFILLRLAIRSDRDKEPVPS
jgi:NhaA family Na+:H+ antiporter